MGKYDKDCENRSLNLGKILKKLRISNGFTQNEVADMIHVSRPCYSSWENNYHEIPLSKLICLGECYNIGIEEIIVLIKDKKEETRPKADTPTLQQIIDLNNDINQMKDMLSEILEKQNHSYTL